MASGFVNYVNDKLYKYTNAFYFYLFQFSGLRIFNKVLLVYDTFYIYIFINFQSLKHFKITDHSNNVHITLIYLSATIKNEMYRCITEAILHLNAMSSKHHAFN